MHGHIEQEKKEKIQHRLKIIQGQILGLDKMVENEEYCMDILNQSLAIQQSLKSFDALMLENHLKTHLVDQLKGSESVKAVSEMIKLYKLSNK